MQTKCHKLSICIYWIFYLEMINVKNIDTIYDPVRTVLPENFFPEHGREKLGSDLLGSAIACSGCETPWFIQA